ncbi:hypothetical protein BDP55DRAFT_305246 [Colletotrichum godetiae]|uniref:Uncharacterized protein n=1 Tax=Colletotrichum godetiae TaxID=1209918 RepID=A0AAJ0AZ13_9PEZI|nr:uncharacterized protein BDP55DRAFT_305246 [Colletotrichum godetiae]KAK1690739.1 hypothetical protein BDP55DRAFT_305246 [Colletotrichum godetiae]
MPTYLYYFCTCMEALPPPSHLPNPIKTVSNTLVVCTEYEVRIPVRQFPTRGRIPSRTMSTASTWQQKPSARQCLAGAFVGSPLFSQRGTAQVCLVLTGHGKGTRDDDGDPMLFTVELQCSCQDERVDTNLGPHWRFSRGVKLTSVHGPLQRCPRSGEEGGASQHFWPLGRAGTRSPSRLRSRQSDPGRETLPSCRNLTPKVFLHKTPKHHFLKP